MTLAVIHPTVVSDQSWKRGAVKFESKLVVGSSTVLVVQELLQETRCSCSPVGNSRMLFAGVTLQDVMGWWVAVQI